MKIKKGVIAAIVLILVVSGGLLTSLILSHQLKSTNLSEENSSAPQQAVPKEPATGDGTDRLADQDGSENDIPDRESYENARTQAFAGMSEDDIGYVESFVSSIYVPLEEALHDGALENAVKDPQDPVWTIFDRTGEIITGYAYDQEIWDKRDSLGLTEEEFRKTYGEPIYYDNKYDADGMTAELKKTKAKIQDPAFKRDFDSLITLVGKMADTHDEKYVYETEEILHDMYYYLFHYGPELALTSDTPGQTPAFYGVLNVYQSSDNDRVSLLSFPSLQISQKICGG